MTTDEQRVRDALAAAAANDRLQAPDHVEKALVAHLRRRNFRGAVTRVATAGSLAAAVLVGLLLLRPEPAPPVLVSREIAPPVIMPAPVAAPAKPVIADRVRPPRRVVRRPAATPRAERPVPVEQAHFIPVGPWQAIEPIERGSIIRVRLPKSSLPGFGIPVSPDRWHESIPADVVLAEDGSMRAVRFVTASQ